MRASWRLRLRTASVGSDRNDCLVTISTPASMQRFSRSSTVCQMKIGLRRISHNFKWKLTYRYEYFLGLLQDGDAGPAELFHQLDTCRIVHRCRGMCAKQCWETFAVRERGTWGAVAELQIAFKCNVYSIKSLRVHKYVSRDLHFAYHN